MDSAITISNLTKTFRDKNNSSILTALKDIDLDVRQGEFLVLLGPSGSGKSTLLRILCGLDTVTHGHVKFNDKLSANDIGFVFQQFALLPWLSVADNIGLGLLANDIKEHDRDEIVGELLKQFGLERFADSHIRELSGGMKQRVGIARALAIRPKILFLDEPFSELDIYTADELRADLLKIWKERSLTIVMVSHLVAESLEMADRIAVFTPRPGHIEKIIVNHLPRPRHKRSPEFFILEDELTEIVKPSQN